MKAMAMITGTNTAGLAPLSIVYHAHDTHQHGVAAHGAGTHRERTVAVDRACIEGVAFGFGGGDGFAVEHALVDVRGAVLDNSVGGDALARAQQDQIPRGDTVNGNVVP